MFNFSCIDAQSTHLATPEFIITPLGTQDQVLELVVVDVVVVVVVVFWSGCAAANFCFLGIRAVLLYDRSRLSCWK